MRVTRRRPVKQPAKHTSQEFVIEADHSLSLAGVALAAAAAKELTINPAGLMALGRNDKQPAGFSDTRSEPDVGPAAGHICRHRDAAGLPSLGHDLGLSPVLSCIKHAMSDLCFVEQLGNMLAVRHRSRADKNRAAD